MGTVIPFRGTRGATPPLHPAAPGGEEAATDVVRGFLAIPTVALVLAFLPLPFGSGGSASGQSATEQQGGGPSSAGDAMAEWRLNLGVQERRDGALFAAPPNEGLTSYFVAPDSLLGDWTGLSIITFEKMSHGGTYYPPDSYGAIGDVVIRSGRMMASFTIEEDHSGEWRRFEVPLGGSGWSLSGGAEALADLLASVTDFRIRAEYGVGTDHAGLRNVSFD